METLNQTQAFTSSDASSDQKLREENERLAYKLATVGIANQGQLENVPGWGWASPSQTILELAQNTLKVGNMKSGEFLAFEGFFSYEEIETLINKKPRTTPTLEYFSTIEPRVTGYIDRYKVAQKFLPFYDLAKLDVVYTTKKEVIDELDKYTAVVANLDHEEGMLLIFGSYEGLSRFQSLGRGKYNSSALYQHYFSKTAEFGKNKLYFEPKVGLAPNLSVTQRLRELRSADESEIGSSRQSNHWSVSKTSANVLREEKDLAGLIDYCLENEINDISLIPDANGSYTIGVRRYGDVVRPEGYNYFEPMIADKIKRFLLTRSGANPLQASRLTMPKDGSITYSSGSGSTFMRCSFIPTNHRGDVSNITSISLRLLPQGSQDITLSGLNLSSVITRDARNALRISSGLILVVGPTNSGKSTTIAGAMNEHISIFGETRKRLSLEDPIERFLKGVIQFEPYGEEEDRFDHMLRSFKRHDPDVVWVGEIRDRQTAELSVDTAASGHLVLSTLHANDTVSGVDLITRLVPETKSFQLVESLSLVISQRLVKTVCPHCSSRVALEGEELDIFDSYLERMGQECKKPEFIIRANPSGCESCRQGYNGMVPINESLPMTRKARDITHKMLRGEINDHQTLASHRTLTMLDSAMDLVRKGQVELLSILT
jgi:type II secretory ATPase GspE/PulE/Tfp pilus assembly ATPase PilB-like protein